MNGEPKFTGSDVGPGWFPGGRTGFSSYDRSSPRAHIIDRWRLILKGSENYMCFGDLDFAEPFITSVPNPEEQDKYVRHTYAYLSGLNRSQYDPHYVLVFRRSLPTDKPKPEQYWTKDYIVALRGLKQEIVSAHRLYSVILCTTLEDLHRIGLDDSQEVRATSEGEIKIKPTPFDQRSCIVRYRPKVQQEELDAYLKTEGALTLEELLEILSEAKKK